MPALSGSQKAYLQARSGIARSGSTRSGYYTPNVVLMINSVDRSTRMQHGSLRISQAINDQPDTATFRLTPGSTIPAAGQPVIIGLGTSANREFAGQVNVVSHERREANGTPWLAVSCVDWQRLFDRRRITYEWTSTSATTIAQQIVSLYTTGFTSLNVQTGLATIDDFAATNEYPSALLRRLIVLLGGGGFYIDPDRDLHFFGSGGETGTRVPTAPVTLTNSLAGFKGGGEKFTHDYDVSQIRTRVTVEGRRTRLLRTLPVSATIAFTDLPVDDASMFNDGTCDVRVGTETGGSNFAIIPILSGNRQGGKLTANAAVGDTSITVDNRDWYDLVPAGVPSPFIKIGDQVLQIDIVTGVGPYTVTLSAAIFGTGSDTLRAPLSSGTAFTALDCVRMTGALTRVALIDAEVVMRISVNDAAAQAVIAAIEGGDGVHEDVLEDSRLNLAGATALGTKEVALFSASLLKAKWVTEDLNAKPGRLQGIALTVNDALTASLIITRSEVEFIKTNELPRRHCEATPVRLAGLLDVAVP